MNRSESLAVGALSILVTLALLFAADFRSLFVRHPLTMTSPATVTNLVPRGASPVTTRTAAAPASTPAAKAPTPAQAVQAAVPAKPLAAPMSATSVETPAPAKAAEAAAPTKTVKAPTSPRPLEISPPARATNAAPPAAAVQAAVSVTPAAPAQAVTPAATGPLARGRQLTNLFYSGQLGPVWAAFLPSLRAEWGDFSAFKAYRTGGQETYGAETKLLKEDVIRDGPITYYTRTARFERGPKEGWTVIVGLDGQGQVKEFGVVGADLLPAQPSTSGR